ncbi:AAA family ATPase [Roseibium sp. FZY0029]|uniref:AAA family ATPase n=1 Tax=Roseibium sp. FZY0029 TaxID=3116647 RepID=UPI002EB7151A|nr:AAA family ATPase [Roseibium sp. FZY0029]
MNRSTIRALERPTNTGLLIARMAVRQALRHAPGIRNRDAYIIGVLLPDDIDTKIYETALEIELQRTENGAWKKNVGPSFHYFLDEPEDGKFRRRVPFEEYSLSRSIEDHQRLIAIGTPKHPMPDNFLSVAENVIEIRKDPIHIGAAIFLLKCHRLPKVDCQRLIANSLTDLGTTFRGNRPIGSAIALLDALTVASTSRLPIDAKNDPAPRLEDTHGYGQAQAWGLELARDLTDWKSGVLSWSDVDRGALLEGRPGTGKTRFAKSLAVTCNANFVECSLAKTQAKGHLGDMLRAIGRAFSEARKNTPAILFVDEFDAIGNRASLSSEHGDYLRRVITGMLEFIDGAEPREGVVVIGACNSLENIDAAFLRPGRLDRVIRIDPPDLAARQKIFAKYLGTELPGETLLEIGQRTEGWTGADLERLARDTRRKVRRSGTAIESTQVLEQLSGTVRKSSSIELERYAVHEAGHVIAAYCLQDIMPVAVSIQEFYRRDAGETALSGGETILIRKERAFQLRSDYLNEIAVALAGHAAENLVLQVPSDGAGVATGSDLDHATFLAARLLASSGVGENLVFRSEGARDKLRQILKFDTGFAKACDDILKQQMKEVAELLKQNEPLLRKFSRSLLERKKLSRGDIARLLEGAGARVETPVALEI